MCPLVHLLLHPMVRPYVPPLCHVSVSASVRTSIGASVRPPLWFILSMYCTEAHFAGGTYGCTNGCSNGRTNGHMTQMGGRTEAPSHKSISCLKIKDDQKEEDQKEDGQN